MPPSKFGRLVRGLDYFKLVGTRAVLDDNNQRSSKMLNKSRTIKQRIWIDKQKKRTEMMVETCVAYVSVIDICFIMCKKIRKQK